MPHPIITIDIPRHRRENAQRDALTKSILRETRQHLEQREKAKCEREEEEQRAREQEEQQRAREEEEERAREADQRAQEEAQHKKSMRAQRRRFWQQYAVMETQIERNSQQPQRQPDDWVYLGFNPGGAAARSDQFHGAPQPGHPWAPPTHWTNGPAPYSGNYAGQSPYRTPHPPQWRQMSGADPTGAPYRRGNPYLVFPLI